MNSFFASFFFSALVYYFNTFLLFNGVDISMTSFLCAIYTTSSSTLEVSSSISSLHSPPLFLVKYFFSITLGSFLFDFFNVLTYGAYDLLLRKISSSSSISSPMILFASILLRILLERLSVISFGQAVYLIFSNPIFALSRASSILLENVYITILVSLSLT